VPGCSITIEEDYAVPGLAPEKGGAAEALCRRLTRANSTATVSYSSEAGQFQAAGLSTVLLGPGSIEQAHIADEFIEVSQLAACEDFISRLIQAQAA
ncbi:MAG TPA: M20/M25/M40 family metallo-hydrolase, partial [Tianweitania sediminis]|nr:M20/M25/M40 family metallo-hydrolase [Tianweitania sediminis]